MKIVAEVVMGKLLESSADRRLQSFRRELTLDLVTRYGRVWGCVSWIRELLDFEAEVRMPPELNPGRVHLPPNMKPTDRRWTMPELQRIRDWMALLLAFHNEVIPPDHQVEGLSASSLDFWMGFLSACVVYDPPADQLLSFADHGVAAYGEFLNPLNPWAEEDAAPQMFAPPIRFLIDAEELLLAQAESHHRLLDALHERLKPEGIDLWELVLEAEFWTLHVADRDPARNAARALLAELKSRPQPYIEVRHHTTESDVRSAFRLMAAALPKRPQPIRPRVDPLIYLQCAIWYDECHWSHEKIAEHFGWAVQRPADSKPKSESARHHIARGRELLLQRKSAA